MVTAMLVSLGGFQGTKVLPWAGNYPGLTQRRGLLPSPHENRLWLDPGAAKGAGSAGAGMGFVGPALGDGATAWPW